MKKKKELWEKVIQSIKKDIPKHEFSTWFANASLKQLDGKTAVIKVPNKFIQEWMEDNYSDRIQSILRKHLNFAPEVTFSSPSSTSGFRNPKRIKVKKDASLSRSVNPRWSFDNFSVNDQNNFAYSSSLELADHDFSEYKHLYIYGKKGTGKSHLLNAIANHIIKHDPSATVSYLPAETLCARADTDSEDESGHLKYALSDTTCFLLDNVHLLGGSIRHQRELVTALDQLYERKIKVAVAGRKSPSKISRMLPELTSRLEWGVISEIKDYDRKTKAQIIRDRARMDNLDLSENTVFFISNHTDGLDCLESYANVMIPRDLSLYSIKSFLNIEKAPGYTIKRIQKATAVYFNMAQSELLSNKKNRTMSYPRQLSMYLSRELTGFSYKDIGKAFGNKNHSTVIYAVRRIKEELITNKETLRHINELTNLLG